MKKILAIDFGTKRVGLAVSRGTLAEPLSILTNDALLFDKIRTIAEEEKVELLLVGLSEREMAELTKNFATVLAEKLNLPLEYADETLSSETVHHKLATGPMKRSRRQQPIDHYAAAEFLQEWIDTQG